MQSFKLRDYDKVVAQRGLALINYPIIEMAPPDNFEAAVQTVEQIVQEIESGHVLAMHCRGGVGRAGMMAACVLARLGQASSAEEAIKQVNSGRR